MSERGGRFGRDVVELDRPNAARMYDYYLGGAANFAVDRHAAEQAPFVGVWARDNRSFLGRVVRYLCQQGIDQFLDLGSGVPTVGNVHEIAEQENSAARVAYIDCEPVAVAHAQHLLRGHHRVTMTQADIRDPCSVLTAQGVAGLLDFTRPVAILAVAILHFISDADQPAEFLARYRNACAPGSYLAISHGSAPHVRTELGDERFEALYRTYQRTATPVTLRHPDEIPALMAGYELVEPGMVTLNEWRPDLTETAASTAYGLVGHLSH